MRQWVYDRWMRLRGLFGRPVVKLGFRIAGVTPVEQPKPKSAKELCDDAKAVLDAVDEAITNNAKIPDERKKRLKENNLNSYYDRLRRVMGYGA